MKTYSTTFISYSALVQLVRSLYLSLWTYLIMMAEQSYAGCVMDINGYFLMHENIVELNNMFERQNSTVHEDNSKSHHVTSPIKPILRRKSTLPVKVVTNQPCIPIISIEREEVPSTPIRLKRLPSSYFQANATRFSQITPPISPLGNFRFPSVNPNNLMVPSFEITPPPSTLADFKSNNTTPFSPKRLSFSAYSFENHSPPVMRNRVVSAGVAIPKPSFEIKRFRSSSQM